MASRYSRAVRLPRSRMLALVALAALTASPATARAGDDDGAIAVLPFTSADKQLEIYGVPVSRALAVELRGAAGAPVQIVSDPTSLPRRIAWVIDGVILQRGGGTVVLEARLRDPDRGHAAGRVATRARPLRQIDRLAQDLARQLLPALATARADRQREKARRAAVGIQERPDTAAPAPRADPGPPLLLVGRTGGGDAVSGVRADPVATASAVDLAPRLGRRPLVMELSGIAPADAVRAALAGAGASHALLTQVLNLDFSWLGVLTARGRVRVVLVDAAGAALYDEIITTDTLVGSRGDRHPALLGFVSRQALEMAAPRLRRLLRR
jgi:hypothetical protein